MFLSILGGVLGVLTFLPFNFFYVFGFAFLIPLFVFYAREKKFWRLIGGTFLFRLILISGTAYYTFEPITWSLSILVFLGLAVSIFLLKKLTKSEAVLFFFLPLFWTIWDILEARYSLLPGYAIALGNAFGSSPFLGLAGIGGIALLTIFAATINTLAAAFVLKLKTKERKIILPTFFFWALLLVVGWQVSQTQLQKNALSYSHRNLSFKIASVSTDAGFGPTDWPKLVAELQNKKIDLLVLPEDILNYVGFPYAQGLNELTMSDLSQKLKTNVLATFDTIEEQGRYNSSMLFDAHGKISDIRHKNRLTFIGEYWPLGSWHPFFFDWIRAANPEYRNYVVFNPEYAYARGLPKVLSLNIGDQKINFAPLVCLESYYPDDLQDYKNRGARFIVNPTSNRWLDVGVNHFLYLSDNLKRIESVWLDTPVISSGVNEFAGITLPDGISRSANYRQPPEHFGVFWGEIKI